MDERRRHVRIPVSWTLRLWTRDGPIVCQAVDVSISGLRLKPDLPVRLEEGKAYRIEVVPTPGQSFACVAEVGHLGETGIGVEAKLSMPQL